MPTYNWPAVYFFHEAPWQHGEIPLWMGTSAGGLPLIGNPTVRVFYPPQLLISLLPIPILWGYTLLNMFHFWLAGMGSCGLVRSVLKVDYPAGILAGLLVTLTRRLSSKDWRRGYRRACLTKFRQRLMSRPDLTLHCWDC